MTKIRPQIVWDNDRLQAFLARFDGTPYIPLAEETLDGIFTEHPLAEDEFFGKGEKYEGRLRMNTPMLFVSAFDELKTRYGRPVRLTRWYPVIHGIELVDSKYEEIIRNIGILKSNITTRGVPEITRFLTATIPFDIGTSDLLRPNLYIDHKTSGRMADLLDTHLKMELSDQVALLLSESFLSLSEEAVLSPAIMALARDIQVRFTSMLYRRLALLYTLDGYEAVMQRFPTLEDFRVDLKKRRERLSKD